MFIVYIIRNLKFKNKIYIGYTTNLRKRMYYHNNGLSIYTSQYKPWEIETTINFSNENLAKKFEQYLKTGSGKAFLRKHLINI